MFDPGQRVIFEWDGDFRTGTVIGPRDAFMTRIDMDDHGEVWVGNFLIVGEIEGVGAGGDPATRTTLPFFSPPLPPRKPSVPDSFATGAGLSVTTSTFSATSPASLGLLALLAIAAAVVVIAR